MRKAWIIARNDLQMTLQDKRNWLLLVALPALVIYLVGLGAQGFARHIQSFIRIDVLDGDDSAASRAFVSILAENRSTILVCPVANDPLDACALGGASLSPALAEERLAKRETSAILSIPQSFGVALERGEEVALSFRSEIGPTAPEIAFWAVQSAARRTAAPVVAARLGTRMAESLGLEAGPAFYTARLQDARAAWGPSPPVAVVSGFASGNTRRMIGSELLENGFKLSTPSIAAIFVMVSILGMAQSLAEERMMGLLGRLGMMPVSRIELVAGKSVACFLLGMVQFSILLAFGGLLGVDFGGAPLAAGLLAGAYALAITAMALTLAALARTPKGASAIATFAWIVLTALGGAWWPLAFVPHWMQVVGHLSPVAWCLDGFNALLFQQGTLADVLICVGVLLLYATAFLAFGARSFTYWQSARGIPRFVPHF